MKPQHQISVVIPTINEEKAIGAILDKCSKFAFETIVVDGGSTDATVKIATEKKARIIIESRRGYGLAYLRGFAAAKGSIIATADGDGTYPVEEIPRVIETLVADNLKFISCCRFPLSDKRNMPQRNQIGNKVLSKVGSALWMREFKDILSGMWVFQKDSLQELSLYSRGWNFSQEIKIEAFTKFGAHFREVRIPYYERLGVPKLSPWKVGAENLAYFAIQRMGLRKAFAKK